MMAWEAGGRGDRSARARRVYGHGERRAAGLVRVRTYQQDVLAHDVGDKCHDPEPELVVQQAPHDSRQDLVSAAVPEGEEHNRVDSAPKRVVVCGHARAHVDGPQRGAHGQGGKQVEHDKVLELSASPTRAVRSQRQRRGQDGGAGERQTAVAPPRDDEDLPISTKALVEAHVCERPVTPIAPG